MRFSTLTACLFAVILMVGTAKAAWTVIYDPYTRKTAVVYVPDNYCPHNHYNPYSPYQPYGPAYRPYNPQPVYQFNFGHDNHGHGGKNHGGHGQKHPKYPRM